MNFANATTTNRKSGVAQWRDLCVDAPSWKCFSTVAEWRDLPLSFSGSDECNSNSVPEPQGRRVLPTNTRYKASRSYPAPVLFPIVVRGRDKCSP